MAIELTGALAPFSYLALNNSHFCIAANSFW